MHFSLNLDHEDFANPARKQSIRAAAYFLLHTIGDIPSEDTSPIYDEAPTAPPVAPAAMATATGANAAVASAAVNTSTIPPAPTVSAPVSKVADMRFGSNPDYAPPPPPPPPNVPPPPSIDDGDEAPATFPTAGTVPPPPLANTAATNMAPNVQAVTTAADVSNAASASAAEFDSAGMPWDARIHQKAKGKKKDNTWKLIKGIDPAVVQAVTAELAARKGASAPVSLPGTSFTSTGTGAVGTYTVSVPPVTNVPAPPVMPAPPAAASAPVPVPPPPAVGPVGTSPYRALIDKITELTKANKLAPAKVAEICQTHGAPSLMALNGMQAQMSARDFNLTIVQAVSQDIDAAALGLL